MDGVQQGVEAAVGADERAHGGYEDRYHGGLKHTGNAAAHAGEKLRGRDLPGAQHDDRACGDADQEHHEYVDADDTADQNQHVGKDLDQVVGLGHGSVKLRAQGQHQDEHQGDEGGGKGDAEVFAEFVLHGAALSVAGGDGGVGDKGKVVAEHGAAHDGGNAQRHVKAGGGGYRHGDGSQKRDRSDGGSHGGGDKARHHEKNRHRVLRGDQGKHEIRHALGAASADDAHKGSGGQKDQDHGDNVPVCKPLRHQIQFFVKADLAVLQAGDQDRRQESDDNGNVVEAHGDFQYVLKQDAKP